MALEIARVELRNPQGAAVKVELHNAEDIARWLRAEELTIELRGETNTYVTFKTEYWELKARVGQYLVIIEPLRSKIKPHVVLFNAIPFAETFKVIEDGKLYATINGVRSEIKEA